MKLKDLIDRLSQLPPETEIHFEGYEDDEAAELIDELVSDYETISVPECHVDPSSWNLLPLRGC